MSLIQEYSEFSTKNVQQNVYKTCPFITIISCPCNKKKQCFILGNTWMKYHVLLFFQTKILGFWWNSHLTAVAAIYMPTIFLYAMLYLKWRREYKLNQKETSHWCLSAIFCMLFCFDQVFSEQWFMTFLKVIICQIYWLTVRKQT